MADIPKKITYWENPHFPGICEEFLRRSKIQKVNAAQFFADYILPRMPEAKQGTWQSIATHLRKQLEKNNERPDPLIKVGMNGAIAPIHSALATQKGIHYGLNIGFEALKQIKEDPSLMSLKERVALLFTCMNAQNNRVNAIAALRKDNREEKRFQKSFTDAAYADIDDEDMEKSIDIADTKGGENDKDVSEFFKK